jgi:hypothetical protein
VPVEVLGSIEAGEGGFVIGAGIGTLTVKTVVGCSEPAGFGGSLGSGREQTVAGEALVPDLPVGRDRIAFDRPSSNGAGERKRG